MKVLCEHCKKEGTLQSGTTAPLGWLYLEATDSSSVDPERTAIIILACSQECAMTLWKSGPGPAIAPLRTLTTKEEMSYIEDLCQRDGHKLAAPLEHEGKAVLIVLRSQYPEWVKLMGDRIVQYN